MKKVITFYKKVEYWEGDGMRPGDNIRSGVFYVPYVTPEEYKEIEKFYFYKDAVNIVLREIGSNLYLGELLVTGEEEPPDERTKFVLEEFKKRFERVEYVFETKETPPPPGLIKITRGFLENHRYKRKEE